ncbi:MAG: thioredoxin family protein [Thermoguttaceae bacterium]|nr:thioredoxin family protein [Thermoguttaceae bacterium]
MMCAMMAGAMSLSLIASEMEGPTETYAVAYKAIVQSGRPMVVMVGTEWCPPCQAMKRHVLPELRKRRWFGKIAFARVNADDQADLARRLTGGGPVPQLVMFRKTRDGWVRRKLIGRQSVETVERFVEQGIALDEAAKRAESAHLIAQRQHPQVAHAETPEQDAPPDLTPEPGEGR